MTQPPKLDELKPCPFCGSEDVVIYKSDVVDEYHELCNSCEVTTKYSNSLDGAIALWNTREGERKK